MPVKIWERLNGRLTSSVETSRKTSIGGEEYRSEAEALDQETDQMLDNAAMLANSAKADEAEHQVLLRRWAVGRSLNQSGLLQSKNLEPQERDLLWLAIARKCRLGIRADGAKEDSWQELIPTRTRDPKRIGRDVLAVGLWLQEQEFASAAITFAGRFGNAQKFYTRQGIRSLNLREALARWMECQDLTLRGQLSNIRWFKELIKTLAARFPARGPGSAKRPVHFSEEELFSEVCKVLDPLVTKLAQSERESVSAETGL